MKVIKLALRSILHFRMYSGINMLGMALSLACVIIIFRYVHGELTVDRFNEKLDRIYVTTHERVSNAVEIRFGAIWNPNNSETFVDLTEHPGVEKHSLIQKLNEEIDLDNQKYYTIILQTDSNFLKITDYPVIMGVDRLYEPNTALITESYAQKLFGNENPIGKTFKTSFDEIVTITGIIGSPSTKATLSFDIIASLSERMRSSGGRSTLVLLYPNVDYQEINRQYEDFFKETLDFIRYQLFPLSKVYFDKKSITYRGTLFMQGNYTYIKKGDFGMMIQT